MSSILRKSALLAVAFVLAQAGLARASDSVAVNVPFPFVVHGRMLPAGHYMVERDGTNGIIIRGEGGTHAAAIVETLPAGGHDPAGQLPSLTFTWHSLAYQLSGVWESNDDGQTVVGK